MTIIQPTKPSDITPDKWTSEIGHYILKFLQPLDARFLFYSAINGADSLDANRKQEALNASNVDKIMQMQRNQFLAQQATSTSTRRPSPHSSPPFIIAKQINAPRFFFTKKKGKGGGGNTIHCSIRGLHHTENCYECDGIHTAFNLHFYVYRRNLFRGSTTTTSSSSSSPSFSSLPDG
jgi:hypothetical protein